MTQKQFKLPDVGEGLTDGEILRWFVAVGDRVSVNQPLVEIETAKAAVELPSPWAGEVLELLAAAGDIVDVGVPIITIETQPAAAPGSGPAPAPASPARDEPVVPTTAVAEAMGGEIPAGLIGGEAPGGRTAVLVGYGPRTTTAQRRPRRTIPDRHDTVAFEEQSGEASSGTRIAVLAKPPVRKLARDLGVDLRRVAPTGPNGTITRADVSAAANVDAAAAATPAGAPGSVTQREERIAVKGVRRMTAQAMVASAFSAPHVTEFLTIDATRTVEFVARLKSHPAMAGLKVSPLLILAKAMCLAVGRTPEVNASFDEAAQEIVLKHYVNLGIAAATPRGLLVPNIKDAQALSLPQLAAALTELTSTARDGHTPPGDLSGGTITITNVGVFGVDAGTPIINPGESAILALGAIRPRPWVVDDQVMVRQVTTLSLSFDHRVLDGQAGSRFLVDVASVLEDPASALLF